MDYKYTVLANTVMGTFMATLDSNIVLIALPTIIRDLPGTSPVQGLWLIMGYTLISASLLVCIGRLADIFGRVKFYVLGFAVFTVASGLCSIAPNGSTLLLLRLVQGGGSALIFSSNIAILTDAFPSSERGRALGLAQIAGVGGSVLGLVAGGILTETLGWRSIFWINLPIGSVATTWAYLKLKEISSPSRTDKIDFLGNGLFASGLALFLYGLTFGAISGWSTFYEAAMLGGLGCLVSFLFVERIVRSPMMDLSLFSSRTFSAGLVGNLLFTIAVGGVGLTLTFYFQGALGFDAFTAGVMLLPFSVAFVSVGTLSGYLSDRYGARPFSTSGMALCFVALAWLALLPFKAPYLLFVPPMLLVGFGAGLFVAPNIASIMNSVPEHRRGVAGGMSSTLFNVGSLLSLGISFAIIATEIPLASLQAIFAGSSGGPSTVNLVDFTGAMKNVFLFLTSISLVSVFPAFFTSKEKAEPSMEPLAQV